MSPDSRQFRNVPSAEGPPTLEIEQYIEERREVWRAHVQRQRELEESAREAQRLAASEILPRLVRALSAQFPDNAELAELVETLDQIDASLEKQAKSCSESFRALHSAGAPKTGD